MRKTLRASVLVLALALSAHAGEIPCPPLAPPPPSAPAEETTTGGNMPFPVAGIAFTLFALF